MAGVVRKRVLKKPTLLQILVVIFILPLTGAAVLVEYLSWRNERQAIEQLVEQLQAAVGNRIEAQVEALTATAKQATTRILRALDRGDLEPLALSDWESYLYDQSLFAEDITFLYFANTLGDYVELHRQSDAVSQITFRSGRQSDLLTRIERIGDNRREIQQLADAYDPRVRPWYKLSVETGQPVWTDPYEVFLTGSSRSRYGQLPKTIAFSFLQPYYDPIENNLLGIAGSDFTLSDLNEFLRALSISQSG